jgi:F420-non-reducing hydrogenase iron-sulfur subunit
MLIKEPSPIRLDNRLCSRCNICYSVCPFLAISLNHDRIPVIDTQKCMLCGICASACPSGLISLQEFNPGSLSKLVGNNKSMGKAGLVVACRGSTAADFESLEGLFAGDIEKQILVRVPCVGRLPVEFYLTALSSGIKNIVTLQCTSEFCRFKNGSTTNLARLYALKRILSTLGYTENTLTIVEGSEQAKYSSTDCVGCDKCVHVCPSKAISAGPLGTPAIDFTKCSGCGACTLVCPHMALEISGYEFKHISEMVENTAGKIKKGSSFPPAILVFCCQWAEFSNLDSQAAGFFKPNLSTIEIPCFSKLDPINILQAFHLGFNGVLAITCSNNECKSKESRNAAENNMRALNAALKMMGLESRFKVHPTSPRNLGDFEREIESFSDLISSLQ